MRIQSNMMKKERLRLREKLRKNKIMTLRKIAKFNDFLIYSNYLRSGNIERLNASTIAYMIKLF